MIGIDLATRNCGFYFSKKNYFTLGISNIKDDGEIFYFANQLKQIVTGEACYVDFHFNEGYLPGSKRQSSVKSFLAGVVFSASQSCTFVHPKDLRKFFSLAPKAKKQEMWNLFPQLKGNEHEKDAFLLYYYGEHCEL